LGFIATRGLDADILSEETDFLAVVEQRTIAVQESAGSVRHRVVIQMVQLAVVLQFAAVLSEQIRPAHKLILHFARPLTSRPITRQKFFVDVEVDPDVMGDAFGLDADVGDVELAFTLASLTGFETEVLEVVDVLRVHQFGGFTDDGATVVLAQPALERDVVVLDRTTYKSTLVETGGQTGFFGGSEDVGAVQIGQHLVGNALESPRPVAHIF